MHKMKHRYIHSLMCFLLAAVLLLSGCGDSSRTSDSSGQADPAGEGGDSFSVPEWHLIGFAPYQHHDYVYGYYEEEELIRSCTIVMYVYAGESVCAGGETNGLRSRPEYVHLNCGR